MDRRGVYSRAGTEGEGERIVAGGHRAEGGSIRGGGEKEKPICQPEGAEDGSCEVGSREDVGKRVVTAARWVAQAFLYSGC